MHIYIGEKAGRWEFLGPHWTDDRFLDQWRDARPTFAPGQPTDGWHHDHYERLLGQGEAVFTQAADRLLRYDFYPPAILEHTSDFAREGRPMQAGDRLVSRVHVLPGLDCVIMNIIHAAERTARQARLSYITTDHHPEVGQWSAQVDWLMDGRVTLRVDSVSSTRLAIPFAGMLARIVQKQAHRKGLFRFSLPQPR